MEKLVEAIVEIFQKNIKHPILWLVVIVIISISAMTLPYIDHYFFFYDRTIKRVELLEQITALDVEKINKDEQLAKEYNLIIEDIRKQGEANLLGLGAGTLFIPTTKSIQIWKFISGGSLLWLLTLCVPFMNTFKKKSDKIATFFIVLIFGIITGCISYNIPTFYAPMINYLSFPVLIIVILVIALIKSNKKKQ